MRLRVDTNFLIHALATGGAPSARSWTGFPIVRRVRTASEPISYKGPPSIRYRVPAPGCTLTTRAIHFCRLSDAGPRDRPCRSCLVESLGLTKDVQTSILLHMSATQIRRSPGEVRDAVRRTLQARPSGASVGEIVASVRDLLGDVSGIEYPFLFAPQHAAVFARLAAATTSWANEEISSDRGVLRPDAVSALPSSVRRP